MQTVAEQINEMQKIFEEYGSFFETVMKKCKNDRFMVSLLIKIRTKIIFFFIIEIRSKSKSFIIIRTS
jgi:hypothetical protein